MLPTTAQHPPCIAPSSAALHAAWPDMRTQYTRCTGDKERRYLCTGAGCSYTHSLHSHYTLHTIHFTHILHSSHTTRVTHYTLLTSYYTLPTSKTTHATHCTLHTAHTTHTTHTSHFILHTSHYTHILHTTHFTECVIQTTVRRRFYVFLYLGQHLTNI